MDRNIRQRFQQAEDALLDSISLGEASLMSFKSSLNSLYADYSCCLSAGELSDDTISIANVVSSRIVVITKCFLDYQKTREELHDQLIDGMGSILDGLNRVTISAPATLTAQSPESFLPPFIEPAYKWLLANIHNPYPSSDTKANIARSSGCSMNSVAAWFISARRRIGWTTICRKHFNSCRADTVDAASRALIKEDPARPVAPAIIHDFQQLKAATQDLYASTFTKSVLAGDLDALVKDMTEEDRLRLEREKKEHAQEEKKRRKEEKEMRKIQRALDRQAQKTHTAFTSYPSPSQSRTSSPVPTLEESWTDKSEDEEDNFIPPILAGRKRRASVSSESIDHRSYADRPMKRLRFSAKVPTPSSNTSALPSPLSSSDEPDDNDEVEAIIAPQLCSGSSRKRRLSDTAAHAVPKRPRGLQVIPRVHAVSDPLPKTPVPLESNIDDWFQTNFFEIPGPVENVGFDQFVPVDIEVFDGYTFPNTQTNSIEQPFQQKYIQPALVDFTPFDAKLANLEVSSHAPVPAPDLDNLNNFNFFNAISTITPNYSGEAVGASTSIDLIFQPPADLIDPVPSDPFSWTDLLNSEQPFLSDINQFWLPSSCDGFSQLLPEIDLSALQFPPLHTSPQPQPLSPADCARLAKLEQLQLLREQTRLLEQDLAVSV